MSWSKPCPNRAIVFVNETSNPGQQMTLTLSLVWNIYSRRMWWWLEKCLCVRVHVFVRSCTCCVCVITSSTVWKCLWETCLSEDSSIFTTAMISPSWSSGWCVLPFSEFWLCVCVCVFCVEEENIAWSEPAASPAGLKFACFPPICSAQPNQRQHCLLVCS